MTSLPKNIRTSGSQLFFQDKESPQYNALLEISKLHHPDRAILSSFIEDAVDPQEAARYFSRMLTPQNAHNGHSADARMRFLSAWKALVEKCERACLFSFGDIL